MQNMTATTVAEYLAALPEDRRRTLTKVRSVIRKHLPGGYREAMLWGMISYGIPLSRYPDTYNGQPLCYAAIAAHKNFLTLYLMSAYSSSKPLRRLEEGFKKAGKTLDMGKSCVHFKTVDDLPLDVIGEVVAMTPPDQFIAHYEKSRAGMKKGARKADRAKSGAPAKTRTTRR